MYTNAYFLLGLTWWVTIILADTVELKSHCILKDTRIVHKQPWKNLVKRGTLSPIGRSFPVALEANVTSGNYFERNRG